MRLQRDSVLLADFRVPAAAVGLLAEPALLLCKANSGGYLSPITFGTPHVSALFFFQNERKVN